jgi:hypothetical protein
MLSPSSVLPYFPFRTSDILFTQMTVFIGLARDNSFGLVCSRPEGDGAESSTAVMLDAHETSFCAVSVMEDLRALGV